MIIKKRAKNIKIGLISIEIPEITEQIKEGKKLVYYFMPDFIRFFYYFIFIH